MKKLLGSVITFGFLTLLLAAQTPVAPALGDGSSGNPYQIASLENLYWIAANSSEWNKYYLQTADIDASGTATWDDGDGGDPEGWSPIGNTSVYFTGFYNGNDHTISGLYIDRPSSNYVALFGLLYQGAVNNLHLTNVNIFGSSMVGGIAGYLVFDHPVSGYSLNNCSVSGSVSGSNDYVGGIAAYNYISSIKRCSNTSAVTGNNSIGGIIGQNEYNYSESGLSLHITYCFNEGAVSGNQFVGGIAGNNIQGYIEDCYNTGTVNGSSYAGGIAGRHYTYAENLNYNIGIYRCYNSGAVSGTVGLGGLVGYSYYSNIFNSLWDTDVAGTAGMIGENVMTYIVDSYGKTTIEMNTSSTFTVLDWDFTGETVNGTDDIWSINSAYNDGYPYLTENAPSDVPTPITLVLFEAEVKNGHVELVWKTATETNNANFIIYRNDVAIASVAGAGTSTEPHSYIFVDNAVVPGVAYTYVLADVDYANKETKYAGKAVTVTLANDIMDADFAVGAAYPNPFNPLTVLPFELSQPATVKASLFDMKGRKIIDLVNANFNAGHHDLPINASNLSSGSYLVHISIDDIVSVRKISLIK